MQAFNEVTPKWRSAAGDSPIRDLSNVLCIAEIVRRFDGVAVQEVGSSAQAFLAMIKALGEGWAFLVTDVTLGDERNHERLAFVFDQRRVSPSGLACELVVAAEEVGIGADVVWGQGPQDRVGGLTEIARWLGGWAESGDEWGDNLWFTGAGGLPVLRFGT